MRLYSIYNSLFPPGKTFYGVSTFKDIIISLTVGVSIIPFDLSSPFIPIAKKVCIKYNHDNMKNAAKNILIYSHKLEFKTWYLLLTKNTLNTSSRKCSVKYVHNTIIKKNIIL